MVGSRDASTGARSDALCVHLSATRRTRLTAPATQRAHQTCTPRHDGASAARACIVLSFTRPFHIASSCEQKRRALFPAASRVGSAVLRADLRA
eukprot:2295108-Pleurochrysis_carterae.AAC.3